jgi:class 3 adenylate cyclase/tetratricopeptide (TPR) repeat protein
VKVCSSCGAINSADARYCVNCGSLLSALCPRCGTEIHGQIRFCSACGAAIAPEQPPNQERKLVTALFADVVGWTVLAQRLDPEQLKDVMDMYFQSMRQVLEAEGGTVEKFIGDAVTAVFGVPTAHEDDPTRALRAALRMRVRLQEVNLALEDRYQVTLAMRVGVNSGEVVAVTSPGPGEGMVTGDAVIVAARLEQVAEPGQILVSERTARAGRAFRFREVGPLSLKGMKQAIHAVELVAAGSDEEPTAPEPPMVGRGQEMRLLKALYERVASTGRPHLVTIYGEAGVGKSRIVGELAAWAASLAEPPIVVQGRCLPYGDGVTYWPLAEILKSQAGALDSDAPDVALAKIKGIGIRLLTEEVSPNPERAAAALAFTVGLGDPTLPFEHMEPRHIHAEIHEAWRSYFSALSRSRTAMVVVEDTHWADPTMLELLGRLTDSVDGPVLFLCPARAELTTRRPGWGGGRWNFSSVLLDRLPDRDAERLLSLLLSAQGASDEPTSALRARILERSGGNPFFMTEIVRHLVEGRKLVPTKAGSSDRPDAPVDIPDTVQGVLAARIDLLGSMEKRALQSASVVGRVFWPGPVSRVLKSDRTQMGEVFRRLADRGLIMPTPNSSIGDEPEFGFNHVLTRDVAYESLPKRERARAHAQVAQWIEEYVGERQQEFAELLAHHYAQAHQGVLQGPYHDPALVENLRVQALRHSLRASEAACSRVALDQAERLGTGALSLSADPVERSQVLEVLGRVSFLDSRGDTAWKRLRQAADLRLQGAPNDSEGILRVCTAALEVATRGRGTMRDHVTEEEALPYLDLATTARSWEGHDEAAVRLLIVRSFWLWSFPGEDRSDQEFDEARAAGERAAALALHLDRPALASAALDGVGSTFISRGLYGDMGPIVERRLDLARSLEDPWELGDAFAIAAWTAFHVGRYRWAVELATEGFDRSIRGAPGMALHCLDWRAVGKCRLGEWAALFADVELAEDFWTARSDAPPRFAADHLAAAAFAHEVQGDRTAADRLISVSERVEGTESSAINRAVWLAMLFKRRGDLTGARELLDRPKLLGIGYNHGFVLEALCDLLAVQGAWDEARETLAEAREHADLAGLLALPAYADRLEGRLRVAEGDFPRALELLDRARSVLSSLGAAWEAACTGLDLAATLAGIDDRDGAREQLSAAMPTLKRLRSADELAEAERLRNQLA